MAGAPGAVGRPGRDCGAGADGARSIGYRAGHDGGMGVEGERLWLIAVQVLAQEVHGGLVVAAEGRVGGPGGVRGGVMDYVPCTGDNKVQPVSHCTII